MAKKKGFWWLQSQYSHARCQGTHSESGSRCKNMAKVNGLCVVHLRTAGGKLAQDPTGWSRKRFAAEYHRLRAAVLIAIREGMTEVVTEDDDGDLEALNAFFFVVAGVTANEDERKLVAGEVTGG